MSFLKGLWSWFLEIGIGDWDYHLCLGLVLWNFGKRSTVVDNSIKEYGMVPRNSAIYNKYELVPGSLVTKCFWETLIPHKGEGNDIMNFSNDALCTRILTLKEVYNDSVTFEPGLSARILPLKGFCELQQPWGVHKNINSEWSMKWYHNIRIGKNQVFLKKHKPLWFFWFKPVFLNKNQVFLVFSKIPNL